jgi:hypothetical protein
LILDRSARGTIGEARVFASIEAIEAHDAFVYHALHDDFDERRLVRLEHPLDRRLVGVELAGDEVDEPFVQVRLELHAQRSNPRLGWTQNRVGSWMTNLLAAGHEVLVHVERERSSTAPIPLAILEKPLR